MKVKIDANQHETNCPKRNKKKILFEKMHSIMHGNNEVIIDQINKLKNHCTIRSFRGEL